MRPTRQPDGRQIVQLEFSVSSSPQAVAVFEACRDLLRFLAATYPAETGRVGIVPNDGQFPFDVEVV